MAEPSNIGHSIPAPEATEESAPLLYRDDPNEETTSESVPPTTLPPVAIAEAPTVPLVVFTWISLLFSVTSLGLNIALCVLQASAPYGFTWYGNLVGLLGPLAIWTLIVLTVDIINLIKWARTRRSAHILVNLFIDTVVTIAIISSSAHIHNQYIPWCNGYPLDQAVCRSWIFPLTVVIRVFQVVSLLVGCASGILFFMRLGQLFSKSNEFLGRDLRSWKFDFGVGTIQVSFRNLKGYMASGAHPQTGPNIRTVEVARGTTVMITGV